MRLLPAMHYRRTCLVWQFGIKVHGSEIFPSPTLSFGQPPISTNFSSATLFGINHERCTILTDVANIFLEAVYLNSYSTTICIHKPFPYSSMLSPFQIPTSQLLLSTVFGLQLSVLLFLLDGSPLRLPRTRGERPRKVPRTHGSPFFTLLKGWTDGI